MEMCCDICGDIGVPEALLTCCHCKINTEHMYCTRTPIEELKDDWRCKECESFSSNPLSSCLLEDLTDVPKLNSSEVRKGGELHPQTRKLRNESRAGTGDWEKMVLSGKTKYLCVEEALMLPTGENKSSPSGSSRINCQPKTPRRKSGMCNLDRGAIRPRTVLLDFSSHQNHASEPLRTPKPQRPGNMEINEKQLQQSKKLKEELSSASNLRPAEALKHTDKVKELPSEVQLPVARRLVKQSPVPSLNASSFVISGGDVNNNATGPSTFYADNMSNDILLDSDKYSQVPALKSLWKGCFRILDDHTHLENNHLIEAHPQSRYRKKIYEFSKEMPEVLQFESVPSETFWKSLFKESIPDKRDIGLYFFPRVGERSEENFTMLVESISSKNLALRIQIADVELLVFSSKLLPVNCQRFEGKYYLWGVFHLLKRDAISRSDSKTLELSVQPLVGVNHEQSQVNSHEAVNMDLEDDVNHEQCLLNDREEVDMDIDMIGGIGVGPVDIPVRKEPLRWGEPTAAIALHESVQQTPTISRSSITPIATIPSPNVKIEPHCLVPPGFEHLYRLRFQSSSSPVDNALDREVK